jgi:hypothetical protein
VLRIQEDSSGILEGLLSFYADALASL